METGNSLTSGQRARAAPWEGQTKTIDCFRYSRECPGCATGEHHSPNAISNQPLSQIQYTIAGVSYGDGIGYSKSQSMTQTIIHKNTISILRSLGSFWWFLIGIGGSETLKALHG